MKDIEQYLITSDHEAYYRKAFIDLSQDKQNEFSELTNRIAAAGAKNPLSWAYSEVTEAIPQFGRFLFLKSLFRLAAEVKGNLDMAVDFDEDMDAQQTEIADLIGPEKLSNFLKSYSKGLVYNLIGLLDEGNQDAERDQVNWCLMKTDDQGNASGQLIQGLHEDFMEFEDELA